MTSLQPEPRLRDLSDLLSQQQRILKLVQAAPYGAQLMLADPVRFLRESGIAVDEAVVRELDAANPNWRNGAKRYDEIKSGKAEECRLEVHLRTLGQVGKDVRDDR